MKIRLTLSSVLNWIRKIIGGVNLETLHLMKEVFGDECALCNSSEHSCLLECGDTVIQICRKCRELNMGGLSWSSIIKSNYPNKNSQYSRKYWRIVLWISEDD